MPETPVPIAPASAPAPDAEVTALVAKHRQEIDRIVGIMDSKTQQQEVMKYGLDPDALAEHYKPFQQKAAQLEAQDAVADKRTSISGWAALGAALIGMFAIRKKLSGSKLIQGLMIGLTSAAAALTGSFVGSRIFAGRIREESKQLSLEVRGAFERELAVAIENKQRESSPSAAVAEANHTANTPRRDASFVAQSCADKASANAVGAQRT